MEERLSTVDPATPRAPTNGTVTDVGSGDGKDNVSFDAILGGVIAAVTLVLLCTAVALLCYKYRHNGSYRTNEAKGMEFGRMASAAPGADPSARDTLDERRKEFFI